MGSRRFALVLLCGTVTLAGWSAGLDGFAWSGLENTATAIWNRVAARGATASGADAGRVGASLAPAMASAVSSHVKLPGPAVAHAAVPDGDSATVDPAPWFRGSALFPPAIASPAEAAAWLDRRS